MNENIVKQANNCIVELKQNGKARAKYPKRLIEIPSKELTAEFGKGFSKTNLKDYKVFHLTFSDIQIGRAASVLLSIPQTLSAAFQRCKPKY
jgi:hypothetical protein